MIIFYRFLFTTLCLIFTFQSALAQQNDIDDFRLLLSQYTSNGFVDYPQLKTALSEIQLCISDIENANVQALNEEEQIGFYIHAYNAHVIHQIIKHYPVKSVKAIPGFFTNEIKVANNNTSLNDLESMILDQSKNPTIHYLLVCGAKSCPPLIDFDISETNQALEKAEQSILSSETFVRINQDAQSIQLSKIYQWYEKDFGGREELVNKLSSFFNENLATYSISYLPYNWQLNEYSVIAEQGPRYQPTLLFDKGISEFKIFSNYYTQADVLDGSNNKIRHSFFTNTIQYIFGTGKNLNIGPVLRLRSVARHSTASRPYFEGLKFRQASFNEDPEVQYARAGISAYGLQARHEVKRKNKDGFLMIHTFLLPGMKNNEGNDQEGFFDWNGAQYTFQSWFVKDLGLKANIFYDVGITLENLHPDWFTDEAIFLQNTLNNTLILSWFPIKKTTVYGLANISPQMGIFRQAKENNYSFGGFGQIGIGYKYFITDHIEIETLGSLFLNTVEGRDSQTINLGIRYNNL